MGGVAVTHGRFLTDVRDRRQDVEVVATVALNARRNLPLSGPVPLLHPCRPGEELDFTKELVRNHRPDVLMYFHVAGRLPRGYTKGLGVPAVGKVCSWHTFTDQTRDVIAQMSALVFPSKYALEEGLQMGIEYHCPTFHVTNGLSDLWFAPASHARSGIVFVGSLERRKRPDLSLMAAAQLRFPIVFVGDGTERQVLEDFATRNGVAATFRGRLPEGEVAALLRRSSALCVPSESESFGNVYLEAAVSGVVSVGHRQSIVELSDMVGRIGEGCDPRLDSVVDGLKRALAVPPDFPHIKDEIAGRFSVANMTDRYVEILQQAIRTSS